MNYNNVMNIIKSTTPKRIVAQGIPPPQSFHTPDSRHPYTYQTHIIHTHTRLTSSIHIPGSHHPYTYHTHIIQHIPDSHHPTHAKPGTYQPNIALTHATFISSTYVDDRYSSTLMYAYLKLTCSIIPDSIFFV